MTLSTTSTRPQSTSTASTTTPESTSPASATPQSTTPNPALTTLQSTTPSPASTSPQLTTTSSSQDDNREPRIGTAGVQHSLYDLFGYKSYSKSPEQGVDITDLSTSSDKFGSTKVVTEEYLSTTTESLTPSMPPLTARTLPSINREDLSTNIPRSYDDQAQGSLSKFFENSLKQSDSEQTGDNSPTPFCHTEERVEYVDKCETYKLETCHSLNREKCHTETLPKCRPVLKSKVEEVCLNVTDQVCSLVETEEQESVEEVYTVQSCSTALEKVCGHSQDLLVTQKEQLQCVDLPTVDCTEESVTVTDTNCTESVQFNCQQAKYGEEDTTTCVKTPTNKCINTPRQVTVTTCQATTTLCYNLTSQQAAPITTEVCHDQPPSVCRMVDRVRPVVRKMYSYEVSCNKVEREACKLVEKMKLEPSRVMEDRPVCEHHLGEKKCSEEEKLFCYKAENLVEVKVCDDDDDFQ